MTLLQLLDKIDDTAPRTCQTCVHMATHAKCDGCLGNDVNAFKYTNWEPGNWLRAVHAREVSGLHNIVIGGSGEAEVNTRWTPQYTSTELHRVACQCGYYVMGLKQRDNMTTLRVLTDREYRITWIDGQLERIDRVEPFACSWHRHHADPSEA